MFKPVVGDGGSQIAVEVSPGVGDLSVLLPELDCAEPRNILDVSGDFFWVRWCELGQATLSVNDTATGAGQSYLITVVEPTPTPMPTATPTPPPTLAPTPTPSAHDISLGSLFDWIIFKTEEREAFSEIKEKNMGYSAIENMRKLRAEFVAAETDLELYYALLKLNNARRDRHLRIYPVEDGIKVPNRRLCDSAPIHVLPDYSDIRNPTFFVAEVGEEYNRPRKGDLIVGVNGRSMDEYIEVFTPWIRHSTRHGLYWHMAYELPKRLTTAHPNLYSKELNLTLESPSGQRYEVSLPYQSGCERFVADIPYPGFRLVDRYENFNVFVSHSRQVVLLQWLDFEDSLIPESQILVDWAEEEDALDYDLIIDVTDSSGGAVWRLRHPTAG